MKQYAGYINTTALFGLLLSVLPSPELFAKKSEHNDKDTYDYVIVGAGTAGSLMAYYLSNDKKHSVLVLEEGMNLDTDPTVLNLDFPAGNISSNTNAQAFMSGVGRHIYYHEWFTIPMAGLNAPPVQNRPILYGGARCAGGTSTTNTMNFVRFSTHSLENLDDGWVTLTGDEEYGMGNDPQNPTKMLKRWIETATYLPANPAEPHNYWHGYGENTNQQNTVFSNQAVLTNGGQVWADLIANFTNSLPAPAQLKPVVPNVDTFAGPSPFTGVAGPAFDRNNPNYPFNVTGQNPVQQRSDATRSHSSREFLLAQGSAAQFPNEPVVVRDDVQQIDTGVNGRRLTVLYQSTVLNIEWKNCKKTNEMKAKCITYIRNGVCHKARICKKLILCAGINSAALLLKNGVGPRAQLEAAGIPVVIENDQVGQNVENHPIVSVGIAQRDIDGAAAPVRRVIKRARLDNIATLTLTDASLLNVGDWINVSGVGGALNPIGTAYNLNQVLILDKNGNDISYFSLGANEDPTGEPVTNNATATGATPNSSVIKVDQLRSDINKNSAMFSRVPYGWDGLDGGMTEENLRKPGKWNYVFSQNGNSVAIGLLDPAARGNIQILSTDPLHPIFCDLQYLANPSDVTDYIAAIRRLVDVINFLNASGNNNYDIGAAPNRATIAGTQIAPAVSTAARDANGNVTITFAGTPAPVISIGGYITVTDMNVTGVADSSTFNAIGARVIAASGSSISYATSTKNDPVDAIAATGKVFDQSALVTFIRNAFTQNHHFAGSCRMRKTKDWMGGGVVDAFGNVFDTRNVMVCDVSIFPKIGDSSPAGCVYPVALKIAEDLISGRNPKA